ncbi:MAG: 2-amino-4-hydroxy-6-hydroxymethyldihydropteridine diphosphokinase [Planctomycetes bacterium]|nr:2-amino-4-hydroxy-6-hydroxymethyldihydropteridine diphosphokinase [Planctomycetota bacterium]
MVLAMVYIGLGSNLGSRRSHIHSALLLLEEMGAGRVERVSMLVDTEPVGGPPGQPMYANGVALLETDLQPEALLAVLKEIEARVGRIEREHWGPREIDLDILLYGPSIIKSDVLEVPHPRMWKREFVLGPLAEIAPDVVNPATGRTIARHLADLKAEKTGK